LEYTPQCIGVDGVINRVVECRVNCSDIRQELGGLGRHRVRYLDDVLVSHLERGCEEIAAGIAEVDVVDHWDDWPLELGAVDSHRFRNLAGLPAIEEYRCGVGGGVVQATSLSDRLSKRDPPCSKRDLLLATKRAERQE